jgi:hypothetical protein
MTSAVTTKRTSVLIFYGAESKPFDYNPHEQVTALLARAEDVFHIAANRHLMSLFTESGQELPDHSSVEAAGVKPGAKLILRQSTVKGG